MVRRYNPLRKPLLSLSILALCGCFFFLVLHYTPKSPLPTKQDPQVLYISPFKHNLKNVFLKAIQQAKNSITLSTYTLSDSEIIQALKDASKRDVSLQILTHYKGHERHLITFPESVDVAFGETSGLMHEKILVIDEQTIYFSTANMTTPSLCLHENMCIGIYDPRLSKLVASEREDCIETEDLTFYRNPEVTSFLPYLSKAKSSIIGYVFTVTHPEIKKLLVGKWKSGIKTQVFFDHGKPVKGIPSEKHPFGPMLHHKCALIDNSLFLLGSTNWTKAAFSKNREFFIAIKLNNKNKILLDNYINSYHCTIP